MEGNSLTHPELAEGSLLIDLSTTLEMTDRMK